MKRIIGCNAAYGVGGIGQLLAHMVEESRTTRTLCRYLTPKGKPDDSHAQTVQVPWWTRYVHACPPVRWSPSWRNHLSNEAYDRALAAMLPANGTAYMGFVGKALRTFQAAQSIGYDRLELIAANSHVDNVAVQHKQAAEHTGMHDTWLNGAQQRKTHAEYDRADAIYVFSEYARQSFLEAGVAASKLIRIQSQPAPRFQPPETRPDEGAFHVVYVGRLDATKGLPLLIDAFAQWPHPNARLTLVGGWSTSAMRRYMQAALRADSRITVAPGDPLPALHTADVFVHPSFEDGFGYAPAEALACGVPVIVTEDTGMAEYITDGVNGYVVPTGDTDALIKRLDAMATHPLATTTSLWPDATAHPVTTAN